ncbi:ABC transporter ATP-binding protein [Plastorhodobacter daqingensis]|uniref:ABC transporter ATP-binding protein n=1 Tax=Plastorhodobacter daqingensis TaxID=1387281 RepID=A0ABW2UML8_9RHOB
MKLPPPAITVEGCAWLGNAPLFGPLRLVLQAGCWTSLLGVSGAGKTTLLRVLAGLETGARFEGAITAGDGAAVGPRLAFMGQSDLLLPWADVIGNVTLGARLRGKRPDLTRARRLIAQVGLAGHSHLRPAALSGGQRQRVALARTLMEDRAIVLLDEPFSALDARTRAEMQELAGRLLQGRTVLLVTHDPLEAARLSHAAWLLHRGRLEALDLPATPPVRPVEQPGTLQAQAEMLARLRALT